MAMKIIKKGQKIGKFNFLKYNGLVFGDGCVKTILDLKVKILDIILFFGGSKNFVEILLAHP